MDETGQKRRGQDITQENTILNSKHTISTVTGRRTSCADRGEFERVDPVDEVGDRLDNLVLQLQRVLCLVKKTTFFLC